MGNVALKKCPMCGGLPIIASQEDPIWHDERMFWWTHSCNNHINAVGFKYPDSEWAGRDWNEYCDQMEED